VQGVTASTFTLTGPAGPVASATPTSNAAGTVWTLNPTANLARGTYTATLTNGIADTSGNAFAGLSWSFTVGDVTPPTATPTTPTAGATGVSRTANITVTFSEAVKAVNGTNFTLTRTSNGVKVGAAVSYNATTRVGTLNPNPTLLANTQYTVTLTGGTAAIRDAANNPLATFTYTFTTGP
jgi:hypothetical protein